MATSAHRDIFSEKPLRTIRNISNTLAQLADHIIQVKETNKHSSQTQHNVF